MRLRVLTYNVHKCVGTDRQYVPDRIRDTIAHHDPDVVMLQEVSEGQKKAQFHRQVDVIGDLLGLRHRTYFPNAKCLGGGRYGNAVLSRHVLEESRNIELHHPLGKRRSVLHAKVHVRGTRTLHVFNVHLGLTHFLRMHQLRRFLTSHAFSRIHPNEPAVLAGDFNDVWGSLGRKLLLPAGFRPMAKKLRTFPSWMPVESLDWVYVRGNVDLVDVRRGDHDLARRASDHLPLVADVRLA
jgi:endonuclease/exonuclease/phosphatase family metal-dependent hydrolase